MTRRSIIIDGFNHGAVPIPAASRVANVVMTGGVYGMDPDSGKIAEGCEEQARLTFLQLGRILQAAGAGFDDIVRMTFYVNTPEARAAINTEWLKAFPDPASRPARHTIHYDHLPATLLLQCDAMAVV
jgi:enamine deaminase RidA (YjgF/YER057c/UK114 family)